MLENLKATLIRRKYEAFLLSLLIVLFGQVFLPKGYEELWQHFIILQNVLVGFLLFRNSREWVRRVMYVLGFILATECFLLYWIDNTMIRFTMVLIFGIYFFLAAAKMYTDVLKAKKVGNEMIAAVFSGFIMLGLIGSFLYTLIEITCPNSFTHLGEGAIQIQNINYFSFVSLLTIGYGDIVPVTMLAKKTAVLLGLLGNFYLTFVTAVIIGKYLHKV